MVDKLAFTECRQGHKLHAKARRLAAVLLKKERCMFKQERGYFAEPYTYTLIADVIAECNTVLGN